MSFELELSIPPSFFDSAKEENNFESVSEKIAKQFLQEICNIKDLQRGNESNSEPDYISDGKGYEVTFGIKNSLIPQLKGIRPLNSASRNVENEIINDIQEALERKKNKLYSVPTTLVIITVETIIPWYYQFYFDTTDSFMHYYWNIRCQKRNEFFNCINNNYIQSGDFDNIYIIIPTIRQEFALFNISAFCKGYKNGITQVATSNPIAYPTYKIINVVEDGNIFSSKTSILNYSINK